MDRLSQLQQFAAEDPDDPFNQYALALELMKSNPVNAILIFEDLTKIHPDYLPTYYPYAQLLIEQKKTERAENVFKTGIEIAGRLKELKTLKEIRGAYQDWLYERE
jgi:predicted Zn-dependent protease